MATRSRGNGTNFGWLRKSCDISTCDLSPDGNPEKYGRPMKSAIQSSNVHCSHHGAVLYRAVMGTVPIREVVLYRAVMTTVPQREVA